MVKALVGAGAPINFPSKEKSPIHEAIDKGHLDVTRLLLSLGAQVGTSSLETAVFGGRADMVRLLLSLRLKAELVLGLACRQGRLPIIELLLEEIYDGEKSETVIDEAFAVRGLDDSVFRLMLDYASPTTKRFLHVCATGSIATVGIMLNRGGSGSMDKLRPEATIHCR